MTEDKIIKVAQVIGFAQEGGVEAVIMNYYRNIDRSKVQFDFLVESTSKIINKEKIEKMGGHVLFIPPIKKVFEYQKTLEKLFKEGNYDIVHANKGTLNFFALRAAQKAGIKIRISHSHSTSSKKERLRNFAKNLLKLFSKRYATHFFACSEHAGRWLFGNKLFDEGKVVVINNGIYIDKFKFDSNLRKDMRQRNDVDDMFVVGHVGRFMTQKNHLFLIDIFYEIQKIRPNSILYLVGDGPLHDELVDKTRELKINHKVIFSGVHKHVYRYYQMMDCFVFPSLYEGLGMVMIEAQISGLPCFASTEVPKIAKVNDNVEFISLNKTAKDWAVEILTKSSICTSKEEELKRLTYASNFIGSNYDIESESKKLLSTYQNIIKEIKEK